MKTKSICLLIFAVVLVVGGCGGTGAENSSTQTLEMTLLQTEGEFFVEGTVINDVNGDGQMNSTETGIEGVTVDLTDEDKNLLDSTTTNADGYYAFAITVTGPYKVIETDPVGYISITPNEVDIEVIDQNVTVNFFDMASDPTYSVHGIVYEDMNGSGTMEPGEAGVAGVTVTLSGVGDFVTDAAGAYAFAITVTGPYSVSIVEPQGYLLTTLSPVDITVTDADVPVDFGLRMYMDVPVDVKPGSDVNPLNLKSKGVLPVAILGTDSMDVAMIDPASLRFNGVPPLRWSYGDACGQDGFEDMILKFSTPEIAATLGNVQRGDIVTLTMEGNLLDGIMVLGEEMVLIVQGPK
jgi:uncharacterized protein (DUF2141 family)